MSVQILVKGKLIGVPEFLGVPAGQQLSRADQEAELLGRSQWANLLAEVLPRALLAELGLSKILLGSSGAEQFLVVLPLEARVQAEDFLESALAAVATMSGGKAGLLWAITENLGDWTVVRKRLNTEIRRKESAPLAATGFPDIPGSGLETRLQLDRGYFVEVGRKLRESASVSWSPDSPGRIILGEGKHSWPIGTVAGPDSIPLARQAALKDDGGTVATTGDLARRAQGRHVWGVLRGDVDNFGIRIRRVESIEEHVRISVLYKQFFAGELEVLCSMPEFWSKVTVLSSGGDDFAVYGSWDALIGLAREIQRLFERFSQENLKDLPGPDGKTITMALALAQDKTEMLGSVFQRAGERLDLAKSVDKDCFYVLGRTLEWKQLSDAAELKDSLARMVREFGVSCHYLRELCGIYRERPKPERSRRPERPWRFHRRLNRILGSSRSRDFQKARTSLAADLTGRSPSQFKLRPPGRVALEWARLLVDSQ